MSTINDDNGGVSPCVMKSILEKVATEFKESVANLSQFDSTSLNQLKNVVEGYEKIKMVIRVIKLAYPDIEKPQPNTITDPQGNNLASELATKITATVTTNPAHVVPLGNSVSVPALPTTSNQVTQALPPKVQKQTSPPWAAPQELKAVKIEPTSASSTSDTPRASPGPSITSQEFLNQCEMYFKKFAQENKLDVNAVWELCFSYALPPDKAAWAKKTILGKNYSWYQARQEYLLAFGNNGVDARRKREHSLSPARTEIPKQKREHSLSPARSVNSRQKTDHLAPPTRIESSRQSRERGNEDNLIRVHNPVPTGPARNAEEERAIRLREERYAGKILALQMMDNETIKNYNDKFIRYAKLANINLTQNELTQRYVNSLLQKHKDVLIMTLKSSQQKTPPKNIDEMLLFAEQVIERQRTARGRIYARPCFSSKHSFPNRSKRSAAGEPNDGRPLKRSSSSCA